MIAEILEWCVTPCQWAARRNGLLAAQIAIRRRARRCREAWKPHLDNCRKFVAEQTGSGPRGGTMVILGSGHLNDFDTGFLKQRFEKVVMVDAVHPIDIQIRARFSKGWMSLITADLSADSEGVHRIVADADFVVSSCLLSQLPLFCAPGSGEGLAERHLGLLRKGRRWILISDVAERMAGETHWKPLSEDVNVPGSRAEWVWNIAPPGENGPVGEERLVRAAAGGLSF